MRIYAIHFRFCTCFVFALFIFTSNVNSQEFAPLGATWVYENKLPVYPAFPVLVRYTSNRDTSINERNARIIERELLFIGGDWKNDGHEIVTSSGDSAFVLIDDEFKLVFDFTRKAGDTIVVTDEPFTGLFLNLGQNSPDFDHFKYRIDSIVNIATGDEILNVLYVSFIENVEDLVTQWGFQNTPALGHSPPFLGRIMQGVGSLGFDSMLGTSPEISYVSNYGIQELTCYSDSLRSLKFSGIDCDSLIAVYEDRSSVLQDERAPIEIFPNPFTTTLNIKFPTSHDSEILVYDITGSLVSKLDGGKVAYDLSHLAAGTYIIKVFANDYIYKTFKASKL